MYWYYRIENEEQGPIDMEGLFRLKEEGKLTRNTPVWTEGMPEWTIASSVKGLYPDPPRFTTEIKKQNLDLDGLYSLLMFMKPNYLVMGLYIAYFVILSLVAALSLMGGFAKAVAPNYPWHVEEGLAQIMLGLPGTLFGVSILYGIHNRRDWSRLVVVLYSLMAAIHHFIKWDDYSGKWLILSLALHAFTAFYWQSPAVKIYFAEERQKTMPVIRPSGQ